MEREGIRVQVVERWRCDVPPGPLAPDDVRSLWRVLGVRFGFGTATKDDPRAKELGRFAVAAGIIKASDWQERFASYLPLPMELGGPTVFLPFTPGEATDVWPLRSQALVCVHESQHAAQYRKDPIRFLGLFLNSTAGRANYEREARSAAECFRWLVWEEMADPVVATSSLTTAYGCRLADAAVAAEDLRLDEETIRAGGITAEAAAVALEWWRIRTA